MNLKFHSHRKEILAEYNDHFMKAGVLAGERVRSSAYHRARKDTGTMANSIFWRIVLTWMGKFKRTEIVCPTDYAIYNELGTVNTPAQPFMIPGLEENIDKIRDYFKLPKR